MYPPNVQTTKPAIPVVWSPNSTHKFKSPTNPHHPQGYLICTARDAIFYVFWKDFYDCQVTSMRTPGRVLLDNAAVWGSITRGTSNCLVSEFVVFLLFLPMLNIKLQRSSSFQFTTQHETVLQNRVCSNSQLKQHQAVLRFRVVSNSQLNENQTVSRIQVLLRNTIIFCAGEPGSEERVNEDSHIFPALWVCISGS